MIAIIDYGAGNLHSVQNALSFLGAESMITGNKEQILNADKMILPGVGAFGDAMACLREAKLDTVAAEAEALDIPLLGICLGLQLLFEGSAESPGVGGLGLFKGTCRRIPQKEHLKIPHIGWNSLEITKESKLLHGLGDAPYVYFVHSYYVVPENPDELSAYTEYGTRLGVAAERGSIFATQFHPEKSGKTGLQILKNFMEL